MSAPVIEGQRFPPHVHKEFPKWVTPPGAEGGGQVLVQNPAEEAAAMGVEPNEPHPASLEVENAPGAAFKAFDRDGDGKPGGAPKGGNRKPRK